MRSRVRADGWLNVNQTEPSELVVQFGGGRGREYDSIPRLRAADGDGPTALTTRPSPAEAKVRGTIIVRRRRSGLEGAKERYCGFRRS